MVPDGALDEVRRLAGRAASIAGVTRLAGGQHADTWKVDTDRPATSVIVRQFPPGDDAAAREQDVLGRLDGLGGLAPRALGADLAGSWSPRPTSLIERIDGEPDLTPADHAAWARQLGRALGVVHAVAPERLRGLRDVAERGRDGLSGPLAEVVGEWWTAQAGAPRVLTHTDYWSGNVVGRSGRVTGIVDWSGARVGPRGYDVSWARNDLVLLSGEPLADAFLQAYEAESGAALPDVALWDAHAAARSEAYVHEWDLNYIPLGRPDLDGPELRRRHVAWTDALRARLG
jgi:aminoglycoside phosphotransferase (APT) family kinase protein